MNQRYDGYVGILMPTQFARIKSTAYTCPLGQVLLATYLRDRVSGFKAKAIDCERTPPKNIVDIVNGMGCNNLLVGFTLLAGNNRATFEMAQKLRGYGLDVVIGGPEVTSYKADQIMKGRPYIKYGVGGAGERILHSLVAGADLDSIPNLTYRMEDRIINPINVNPITVNPINASVAENLDWGGIRVDYDLLYDIGKGNGVTYLTGNDCFLADKRCSFCGRIKLGNPKTEFEKAVRIQNLKRELVQARGLGINSVYNSADSVGVDQWYLDSVAREIEGINFDFHHMFLNSHELTRGMASWLKALGVTVYIGIENIALREMAGKGNVCFEKHDVATLNLLKDYGIPTRTSFVVGLPTESEDTMKLNRDGILRLVDEFPNIVDIEVNPVEILAGTKLFKMLMEMRGSEFLLDAVPYDPIKMATLFAEEFCFVSRDRVIEIVGEIYKSANRIRQFDVNTKGITEDEFHGMV